ncbi:hypothetical protein DFJ58DRAFT_795495 [Suillus subalutaceus]|uniref:uncharacterized protein n=1 Tax=Suillus subalutaceus TaxID=48586 RepID=UPI001B88260E|nr:uncharacterized protein DFJ58DRAFT_795495 [Suillus subalutaceus]KAG1848928.1 hypothetical protein DFJ58DRAFT_795495 [Suillus subalutaceus]
MRSSGGSQSAYGVLFYRMRNRGFTRSWINTFDHGYIQISSSHKRTEFHTEVSASSITPDHGLLRTVPIGGGEFIDLQPDGPDGNSFDMMKGLISTKKG